MLHFPGGHPALPHALREGHPKTATPMPEGDRWEDGHCPALRRWQQTSGVPSNSLAVFGCPVCWLGSAGGLARAVAQPRVPFCFSGSCCAFMVLNSWLELGPQTRPVCIIIENCQWDRATLDLRSCPAPSGLCFNLNLTSEPQGKPLLIKTERAPVSSSVQRVAPARPMSLRVASKRNFEKNF